MMGMEGDNAKAKTAACCRFAKEAPQPRLAPMVQVKGPDIGSCAGKRPRSWKSQAHGRRCAEIRPAHSRLGLGGGESVPQDYCLVGLQRVRR